MRVLVFLSCVVVFTHALDKALTDELMDHLQQIGIQCAEEEKPPPEDVEALLHKGAPSSHEGKCTVFCMLKKLNMMKDAKTFGEGYTEWLDKAKADDEEFYNNLSNIYKSCEETVPLEDDGCENALRVAMCAQEKAIKEGLDGMFG